MATTDEIVTEVIRKEGAATNDPHDGGGRTQFGISERANPEAWADGKVTEEEARAIYTRKYVNGPGFQHIKDDQLRAHLVDFGVNSGPAIAIQKLQEILAIDVDGILGPQTFAALDQYRADDVNNQLVAARVRMICKIVQKYPSQLKFLSGWISRSLDFLA